MGLFEIRKDVEQNNTYIQQQNNGGNYGGNQPMNNGANYGNNQPQMYNNQGNQYTYAPVQQRTNSNAIAGFILSFFISIVGLILCISALSQIKKTGEKGKGLAIAGLIVSLFGLMIPIFYVFVVWPAMKNSITSQTICVNGPYYQSGSYGQPGYINCSGNYGDEFTCTYITDDYDEKTTVCSSR